MTDDDVSAWFTGKSLSTDWTSRYFPIWASLLAPRRAAPLDLLEIGSWEGRSALFFLNYLPSGHLTCIDTFGGSVEHALRPHWAEAVPQIEARFDANLAPFAGRFEKLKTTSCDGLAKLIAAGRRFDLVYVDGSHHSADALADTVMSWPMVRQNGIVIFDDYEWSFFPEPERCPKLGIDAFLSTHPQGYRELHRGYQLIIEKV